MMMVAKLRFRPDRGFGCLRLRSHAKEENVRANVDPRAASAPARVTLHALLDSTDSGGGLAVERTCNVTRTEAGPKCDAITFPWLVATDVPAFGGGGPLVRIGFKTICMT